MKDERDSLQSKLQHALTLTEIAERRLRVKEALLETAEATVRDLREELHEKREVTYYVFESEFIATLKILLCAPKKFEKSTMSAKLTVTIDADKERVRKEIHDWLKRRIKND